MANPVRSIGAPPATYVNSRGLTENNLVYVAGSNGQNLVASNNALGIKENKNDLFVQTPDGELGIYHSNMMRQFREQYTPRNTGNAVADEARQDFAYCNYVTQMYSGKASQVFELLRGQSPEEQTQSRRFLKEIDEQSRAQAARMGLSREDTKEYLQHETFRAIAEKYKGTELGTRSKEAYALGNYGRDAFNFTTSKCGLPHPGQRNPYNREGRVHYDYAQSIQDPHIQQQIKQQRTLQFLTLLSLFSNSAMGFFPYLMAGWL